MGKDKTEKIDKLRKKAKKCCRSKPRCKKCPVVALLKIKERERAKKAS
ncbi:hypothetical protein LX15_005965 [Streptoalloteichus tenebrarius]|uniref:Uncharacterized protein n=1 Tax=Streptoalloteichus tenebrarius (strain ATCC 17920 / DSM 40477 / JCM 4838 / CBS 697.72 / NBRC 16177 / NCIMB 11028 / NRRL B-12390 / A12253. 1 / ISP 5477) TaxID=1933 RepID=A0ABT1I370_STRSD|nr:hypothetical protein [Streptoalloteichus tenebrarius]MCP2262231.1 hypothetical protein [Streptoalloteichus tenebrarius]BFF01096.1 hypothetical protein GCM10020241_27710 [Streptoalloteichus tenebrarius]